MGPRKRRQDEPCWHTYKRATCKSSKLSSTSVFTNLPETEDQNTKSVESSSCCDSIIADIRRDNCPKQNDELIIKSVPGKLAILGRSHHHNVSKCYSNLFAYFLREPLFAQKSKKYSDCNITPIIRLLLFVILASSSLFVRPVDGVCVWQGGGGFRVACGFRQSGLFRIRSIGGVKGYVGAGFTIGDEDGFKDSLTNTEPQQAGAYVIPNNVHSQRSLPGPYNGPIGQYSQIYEHAMPPAPGDPASQQQHKMQYLENIQSQMENDQQNLHHMANDQQTQKMLEQQLHMQGGLMPPAAPSPTAKVKRAGSAGLTKRASLWNWPKNIFGRGKNAHKKNSHNGPPPPPANRRGGPPHKNKHPGKNGHPPRRGERRGPPPKHNNRPNRPDHSESFINPMKNPFAHLQDNFIGKHSSQEAKRMHNFQQGQDHINQKFANGRHQFPGQPPMSGKDFFQQNPTFSSENGGQVPQQFMMPPASPGAALQLPKFKKIPNNKKPLDRNDDFGNDPGNEHQFSEQPTQPAPPTTAVDRMMINADDPLVAPSLPPSGYFNSQGHGSLERQFNDYEADPPGLKMLKQTENFGQIYHLINPDGSPVNMQFEKQPIIPPGVQFSSQQQQDLVEELASVLPHPNTAENFDDPSLLDSSLATAVYDPNVFPDIYFTTTEKHLKQQQQLNMQDHNMIGGPFSLSQEMMDNPLLTGNQIKRILGISSVEKTGSGEGFKQAAISRKKASAVLRSNEVSNDGEQVVTTPRRKMRRRKKNRMNQHMGNQVDTSEPELTGFDGSVTPASTQVLPKKRRKGRRKKKYRLHTLSPQNSQDNNGMVGSTERLGLAALGDEQSDAKTETPTPDPLTTTQAPERNVVIVTPTSPVSEGNENSQGKPKVKTSFTLPSSEDVRSTSSVEQLLLTGPSSENKIDTSAGVTSTKKTSEETTTTIPMSFSTFGYYDALRNKQKSDGDFENDYESFSGPSGSGNYFRENYDPRFPPDHEVNRGHNMTKFIRPRGQDSTTPSSNDATNNGPFILYDMTGTRNQSRFSSKFHKETSPFTLDSDSKNGQPNRMGDTYSQSPHPFATNLNKYHHQGQDNENHGLFLKFDSREWANDRKNSQYQKDHSSDPFLNHYNKTSLNSGYYGSGTGSKEFRPSVEIPWDRGHTTQSPRFPNYSGGGSTEMKNTFLKGSPEHGMFGPTMETFGLPKSSTPMSFSGEKTQQRKLHKNIFGGSSADVSDDELGNWASPNFWGGTLQEAGRYSPSGDFEANSRKNDMKRLMDFGDPNGLKEMKPVDLSSPTPLPMPSPSSPNTMEDLLDDGPSYFLAPSTPGERWGKQRKRKQKTTTMAPTTPSPVPLVMSTVSSIVASPSSTSAAPVPKWLAMMSNEVDIPPEYYDNISMLPPGSGSTSVEQELKKGRTGKKKGVQIKLRSGEDRDSEEEHDQRENHNVTSAAATLPQLSGSNGYPGVMVHNFESDSGFGFGDAGGIKNNLQMPPPPPPGFPHVHIPPSANSDVSYFPTVVNSDGGNKVQVSSGPPGSHEQVFPPMAQYGPPPPQNNRKQPSQRPIFPGQSENNNRKDFVPSAEDLGPLPPLPPQATASVPGLPSHKDNPFKVFEKQNLPVNSGMGFVSPNQEFREMADQISKFSTIPNTFLRRDSSEKFGGGRVHAPNLDQPVFHAPPAPPASSEMNIPGFVTIPLPSVDDQEYQTHEHPSQFGPSSFPANIRDPEKSNGPMSGHEEYLPSIPPTRIHDMPSGPPPGVLKDPNGAPWDFRPLDNNEVNEMRPPPPPHHHGPPVQNRPLESEEEFRRPPHERPPHLREGERPPGNELPPHLREGPPGPPPHMRDGPPPQIRDGPPSHLRDGPPPHMREGPPPHSRDGPPPHSRDGPPPHLRDGPPPHLRDGPPPHSRDGPPPHLRDGPPPHSRDGPPPHLRDGPPPHSRDGPPPHMREGPPPHSRDEPPPHMREGPPSHSRDGPPGHTLDRPAPGLLRPPPPLRDDHERRPPHDRPPQREDHPPMRPPPPMHDDHLMRPPPKHREEQHPSRPPPPRDDHHERPPPPHRHEQRPPPPHRNDQRPPPPPHREDHHQRHPSNRDERPPPPPGRPNEFPPRGPPGHRDSDRRPPPREFDKNFPPREHGPPRHAEERFRDGPHHGHEPHNHPLPRPNFADEHRNVDNHRPPPHSNFHDKHHEHHGDHSSLKSWQGDKSHGERPSNAPPTPHGMPDFLDLQKVPKNRDQRPFNGGPPKPAQGPPFHQKHVPPSKKPLPSNPTKIPPQVFKPPPPPKSHGPGNFFSNILHGGPFGKHTPNKMHPPPQKPRPQQMPPPPSHNPNNRPHPQHAPPRKPPVSPNLEHLGHDPFAKIPFHEPHPHPPPRDMPPNSPNNYINPFNDRYEPPAPQMPPRMEDPNHKMHLRPEPLPPMPHGSDESRLPFLPFPHGGPGSFESTMVDLDQDPHGHLLPPALLPLPPQGDPSLPVRTMQPKQHDPPKQTPRPVYNPAKPNKKMDEKSKVLEAFETLNKANIDMIHSIAADQYGQKFMDKIKTKSNIVKEDKPMHLPLTNNFFPQQKVSTSTPGPLLNALAVFTTKKPDDNGKLAQLLKMINNKSHPPNQHSQPVASASTMGAPSSGSVDPLSSLLQKFAKPTATVPPVTTTTQRIIPELPSNPGLVSLTSLNQGSGHDIKSLQAQIAKAIIAKAHRKNQQGEQLEKPHYQPLGINAPTNESPLAVLQQLAQNRQATIQEHTNSKNYTASQIETLKKLIALNNLEQKLASPSAATTTTEDPLNKLKALLPAALAKQQDLVPSNQITRKMLDSSTANSIAHQHNSALLQNPDPTLLALKAIAMSKSQGINPQPSISFPQQVKPTEPSSQPIAVDLSAILSPSPPVVEARKRRLTNVRNAPKSFYPANATQGFEDFSGPLMTEFHCDEQSFFPGLYADTELGCRVFHLCAKTEAGYMMKSFRCPKETVFDQEVLRCNWNLFVECPASKNKYHFNKYLSQSFQFLKILGEFSANSQKSVATMTG